MTRKQDPFHHDAAMAPFARMAAVTRRMAMTAARVNLQVVQEALALQASAMSFANRRVVQDLTTARRLLGATKQEEAVETMQAFCAETSRDYAEKTQTLLRMSADAQAAAAREAAAAASAAALSRQAGGAARTASAATA